MRSTSVRCWPIVIALTGCDILSAISGGRGLPCDNDEACPPGNLCIEQRCQPVSICTNDADCAGGWRCEPSSRVCVTIADAAIADGNHSEAARDARHPDRAVVDRPATDGSPVDNNATDIRRDAGGQRDTAAADLTIGDGPPCVDQGRQDVATLEDVGVEAGGIDADIPAEGGVPPSCGNGFVNSTEECDDGDHRDGDGCSANCAVEPFFACSGESSVCHCVYYVDDNPARTGDGSSWTRSFGAIQPAIDAAPAGCEVWVAAGTYRIFQRADTDTLTLRSGSAVYGGFTGTEKSVAERDLDAYRSTLDGMGNVSTSRVHHVVTAAGVTQVVLDGFVVRNGSAIGGNGGGLQVSDASVTISNCRFDGNNAELRGGAIFVTQTGGTTGLSLVGCQFSDNAANEGAAVVATGGAGVQVRNSFFERNSAGVRGGAILNDSGSTVQVTNSVFTGNQAIALAGGAIYNWDAVLSVTNCTFAANSAGGSGGAIRNNGTTTCDVVNSVFWGSSPNEIGNTGNTCSVNYSDVAAGYAGTNNIDSDPLFVAPPADLHLSSTSPCIDVGNDLIAPPTDIEERARWDEDRVGRTGTKADLGAYEYGPADG